MDMDGLKREENILRGGKNPRVGILTFHDTTNFGACLQAVATYKILKEQCCDCEIIDYHCAEIDRREIIPGNRKEHSFVYPIRLFLKHRKHLKKHGELVRFLKSEVQISADQYKTDSVAGADKRYDYILVGSDMPWCTRFTKNDYTFMLDFVQDNRKKYSFATSIGYEWEKNEENIIKEYLDQFQRITVREADMALRLENLLNRKIETVCDPTVLVLPEIWRKYADKGRLKRPESYCLVYVDVPSGQCLKAAKEYAQDKQMEVMQIGFKKIGRICKGYKMMEAYCVEDFLAAIAGARMLFTSSYHGMLFAIYFHIPFVYYNKDFSRLESVAKRLGLERRNGDNSGIAGVDEEIDWNKTDALREEFAEHSRKVLGEMIASWKTEECC